MSENILLINVCKEELHAFEFVEPIKEIVKELELDFFEKKYSELTEKDLNKATRVIICGTSLKDNDFLNYLNNFSWIKSFIKPILGICAGMQLISLIFGAEIKRKTEIGFFNETFKKEFLGISGLQEVYHLHNNYCTLPKNFLEFSDSKIPQAIKHNTKKIYGALFHPEVRQKELILSFLKI